MEVGRNYRQENSTGMSVPLLPIKQDAVLEHYVLTRAIEQRFGAKYETYNAKSARLQSFVIHEWPTYVGCST